MFPPEISICFSFAFLRGIEVGVFYNVNREIDHGRKNVAEVPSVFRLPKGGFHATSFS